MVIFPSEHTYVCIYIHTYIHTNCLRIAQAAAEKAAAEAKTRATKDKANGDNNRQQAAPKDQSILGWFGESPSPAPSTNNTKQTPTPSSASGTNNKRQTPTPSSAVSAASNFSEIDGNTMSKLGESLAMSLFGGGSAGIGVALKKIDGHMSISGVAPNGPANGKLRQVSHRLPLLLVCVAAIPVAARARAHTHTHTA